MSSPLNEIARHIDEAMVCDRRRFRRRLHQLRHQPGDRAEAQRDRLAHEIARSVERHRRRLDLRPRITFPPDLPIVARREEIAAAIDAHPVVVVCGETGSGKSTQLPKICLDMGRGIAGMIGHTQPRRIAARTIARRIAEELGGPGGRIVGSKVRFGDETGRDTLVKVMTDGILLAETQRDRSFEQYDTIIIDEAHERSLNIDFLLGYLRRLLPRRPDLKIIITSATIDPERFAAHFGGAPIIEVSGRTYPVDIRYRPLDAEDREDDIGQPDAIVRAVHELRDGNPGDVLVFLSGEREIRETAEVLRDDAIINREMDILPLFSRLSAAEQNRVFAPHRRPRVVLATNVAETSLTVPGIRSVIDTGEAKISRYAAGSRVQRLPVEAISRASAAQRAGRCGRVADGVCIRLYSEEDFAQRDEHTDPEVQRTSLASVILRMMSLGLGAIESFPFIDPPRGRLIRDGYHTLREIGAIDDEGGLTATGRVLARLPVDPRIARMLLGAHEEHAMAEVLVLGAGLSVPDVRERPMDKADQADAAHRQFVDPSSDFLTLLNIWRFHAEQSAKLSRNQLMKACRQNFLNPTRMREWADMHAQLREQVIEIGWRINTEPAPTEDVHRALLTGLLSNIGLREDRFEYTGTGGTKFYLFPGSGQFEAKPKWVMAAELIETTRLYARTVAPIQPRWVEQLGEHLVKRSYSDPRWEPRSGRVTAQERVVLYGLELASGRRVPYDAIDPVATRDLFIHGAFVEGECPKRPEFLEHNLALQEEIETLEAKQRLRDLLVDQRERHRFYDERVPPDILDWAAFEKWRRHIERSKPRHLFMRREDLLATDDAPTRDAFPDHLDVDGTPLALEYQLEPGTDHDGQTITVPLDLLPRLRPEQLDWLVPGLLRERAEALIRTLPKTWRRELVPVPDVTAACMAHLGVPRGHLIAALTHAIHQTTGVQVPLDAWRPEAVPDHLRMNVRVVDRQQRTLQMGRDLDVLRQALADRLRRDASGPGRPVIRTGITRWDFGAIEETVDVRQAGYAVHGYPALVDAGASVSLVVMETEAAAADATRSGLARLIRLQFDAEFAEHARTLPDIGWMKLQYASIGPGEELVDQIHLVTIRRAILDGAASIRTKAAFEAALDAGWSRLWPTALEVAAVAARVLASWQTVQSAWPDDGPARWSESLDDARRHAETLVFARFLAATDFGWLQHVPRYLDGIDARLRKLGGGGDARDREIMSEIRPLREAYDVRRRMHESFGVVDPHLEYYRWMLEEYCVAQYAQELGTALPVSPQRLAAQWAMVRR
ncbi:MAG: ATP-dependent RNA helicase HrpA [Phycisphaerales bacterium]|nr:ATP-dependent RNA helicase HrpA [Phycisphaerales bacterium]